MGKSTIIIHVLRFSAVPLNPALNSEEMLAELTRLFGLDELDFVRVKNDGSRHYRAYAP